MRVTFVRSFAVILAALAVAFLVACGDDGDPTGTPEARPPTEFEGACSLVATTEIASGLGDEAIDLVIDDQDTTCTISGANGTLTIVVEERESAAVAAAEALEAGAGADVLSIGDGAYLVGDAVFSSRGANVITFTLDPSDEELLVVLARGAAVRAPTPTATPE